MGDRCHFIHDPNRQLDSAPQRNAEAGPAASHGAQAKRAELAQAQDSSTLTTSDMAQAGRQYNAVVDLSRVVPKPAPAAQLAAPRDYQLQQLRRRFSPRETSHESGTTLTFRLTPSDPDFPYEIDGLGCVLEVPLTYPGLEPPRLRVTNQDIPRGYQINVERGFDELVRRMPQATLLQLFNALDRNLESYLAQEKKSTIKIVPNAGSRSEAPKQAESQESKLNSEERARVEAKRETDTRQLEARLGRLPGFSKSADAYTIPLQLAKLEELPPPLRNVTSAKLHVPLDYNLQPCRVELLGAPRDAARRVETAFERRAREHREMSLVAHVNYLAQNMHLLATSESDDDERQESHQVSQPTVEDKAPVPLEDVRLDPELTNDKSHVFVIARPPDWTTDGDEHQSDTDESASETGTSGDEAAPQENDGTGSVSTAERGTSISFPMIELRGIELLELASLSIIVKCERCKQTADVANLIDGAQDSKRGLRSLSCAKCANPLSVGMSLVRETLDPWLTLVGYRMQLLHANSVRAGYIDLEGCTVVDLLPRYRRLYSGWSVLTLIATSYRPARNVLLPIPGLALCR